jgi:hypothetical protein
VRARHLSRATALACAVILAACAQPNGPDSGDDEIPVQPIVTESNSGFVESERRVIRDAIAWATVWARIYENSSPKPPLPAIDFSQEQVLVAALGARPSSGYSIRITGASGSGNAINVKVESESPGPSCFVLGVITRPVTVAKMGRTVGSAVFEEKATVKNCG